MSEPMMVDGKRRVASNVEVWTCSQCGESLLHAQEWRRAEETIRSRYSGQFRLRLDGQLHARLARAAAEDHRSLNQEVVFLIEHGLKATGKA